MIITIEGQDSDRVGRVVANQLERLHYNLDLLTRAIALGLIHAKGTPQERLAKALSQPPSFIIRDNQLKVQRNGVIPEALLFSVEVTRLNDIIKHRKDVINVITNISIPDNTIITGPGANSIFSTVASRYSCNGYPIDPYNTKFLHLIDEPEELEMLITGLAVDKRESFGCPLSKDIDEAVDEILRAF